MLKSELFTVVTPVLPVPVAVAVSVRFEPIDALHPVKVNIPCDDDSVQLRAVEVPVTATEIEPAYGDCP